MEKLLWNLRYAFRSLRKAPGFTIIAVLTLAIGIGANSATFSVVYGVILKPLPFRQPDRLVRIWHTPPQKSFPGMKTFAVSAANFFDWQAQSHSFDQMAITSYSMLNLTGAGEPESLRGQAVSPQYFSVLGVAPAKGRSFSKDDDQPGRNHVVVLSDALWKTHFSRDEHVVGRTISLNEQPYTVIGVMGPDFHFPGYAQYWTLHDWTPESRAVRGEHHYAVVARLKDGVDMRGAQAELDVISQRLAEQYPADDKGWGAVIHLLHEDMVGDFRTAMLVLLGAVSFVLLIACANVANLILAKTLDRGKEIAVRTALGASRMRIMQQILTESVVLAVVSGALGLIVAYQVVRILSHYIQNTVPRAYEISVDTKVLLFTLTVSLLTGFAAGLFPAWRLSSANVNDALKRGLGRTDAAAGGRKARSVLVVAEVALSLMLLAGAGLLLRSFWQLQHVDGGFDGTNVLTARLALREGKLTTVESSVAYYQQILDSVRNLPGVISATFTDNLPLEGGSSQPVLAEGQPAVAMSDQPEVAVRLVGPDFFKTMGITVLQGRDFSESDTAKSQRVAVVSEAFAKRFWPNESAIGKYLTLSFFQGGPRQIVGVVKEVKLEGLDVKNDTPAVYHPLAQLDLPDKSIGGFRAPFMDVVLRSASDPHQLMVPLVQRIHSVDPVLPVTDVLTMDEFTAESLGSNRFNTLLLGSFAAIALLLSAIGIYSVLAYSVSRRTNEIGIRMALGAQFSHVTKMVVGEGMLLVGIGILCGVIGALALARLMQSLLFNVRSTDMATFSAVAALLALVSLLACAIPAYRATRVNSAVALKAE